MRECPPCAGSMECTLASNSRYECVDDCTCEGVGVQCGSADVCGAPSFCGTCADNGFGDGYWCDDGRCVCDDVFEPNDSFDKVVPICGPKLGGVNCVQEVWSVDIQATLHGKSDVDFYGIQTLDAETPIIGEAYNNDGGRLLAMAYLCADGWAGMAGCSGRVESLDGIEFCVTDERSLVIERSCPNGTSSALGTLLVGVQATEPHSDCDGYGLKIIATYAKPESID